MKPADRQRLLKLARDTVMAKIGGQALPELETFR